MACVLPAELAGGCRALGAPCGVSHHTLSSPALLCNCCSGPGRRPGGEVAHQENPSNSCKACWPRSLLPPGVPRPPPPGALCPLGQGCGCLHFSWLCFEGLQGPRAPWEVERGVGGLAIPEGRATEEPSRPPPRRCPHCSPPSPPYPETTPAGESPSTCRLPPLPQVPACSRGTWSDCCHCHRWGGDQVGCGWEDHRPARGLPLMGTLPSEGSTGPGLGSPASGLLIPATQSS